jgi:hypothetical protein
MIKEIKTEKFEGLAVLVPDGFKGGVANMGYLTGKMDNPANRIHEKHFNSPYAIQKQLDRVNKLPEYVDAPAIKLPEGDYKIIGKAIELTEEQCETIAVKNPLIAYEMNFRRCFNLLMRKIECYSENPLGKKPERLVPFMGRGHYSENQLERIERFNSELRKWEEAEKQTGTWLILQKISS